MSELEKAWDELFSSGFYLDGWDFKLGQTQTQQEVKGVLELLGIKKDDHILDWCGGYGRHAIELPVVTKGMRGKIRIPSVIGLRIANILHPFGHKATQVHVEHGGLRKGLNIAHPTQSFVTLRTIVG